MFTVNGIGTKIYGKKDRSQDGSYTTTKWFVVFFFPLIPISSHRVKDHEKNNFMQVKYYFLEDIALDKKQVLFTYGKFILGIIMFLSILLFFLFW